MPEGAASTQPQTRAELQAWIHQQLELTAAAEQRLIAAIDEVFTRHERLWEESKQDAIRALAAGYADRMLGFRTELSAREATVSSIARYFEALVDDLTDRSRRDPKTKLTNFARFTEQLESFLALEQRGRWCAVGLVDITGFKWYNDTLGHAAGDRIIERVAQILHEQVRSDDVLARERPDEARRPDLHARFGGDEFCFLIPDLIESRQAYAIAERFREAVEHFDWIAADVGLAARPVRVDVGVVCLWLGRVSERRFIARRLAAELVQRADTLMYKAKGDRANHIYLVRARIERNELVDMPQLPGKTDHVPEPT
ncbi:MAG: GGDEF domain-containing protein [Acidobacteria bacterium]|nr:GGDEF domain-containing protein [Acidobacteriota bacterium]